MRFGSMTIQLKPLNSISSFLRMITLSSEFAYENPSV